ncbi:hypothetical protein IB238_21395 [Rhizobium sp. ARZ01]|uniref:hypothetical protein n=1 Tax=Rhizobium sp. ARZ01 TaxID=2769313 RepID=UPI00177CDC41|nr:hypothetical protein [Rhizobium sp. ARZ01]MBD9375182.1 hypothetical protein [Rhizobium sp. ARZ01]
MSFTLNELTDDEVSCLKRLADGRVHVVPTVIAESLQSAGLAQQAAPDVEEDIVSEIKEPGSLGTRISDDGLRLLDGERLPDRR